MASLVVASVDSTAVVGSMAVADTIVVDMAALVATEVDTACVAEADTAV